MNHQGYYDSYPCFERNRSSKRSGASPRGKKQRKKDQLLDRIRRDIIAVTRNEGGGVIPCGKFGLAVAWLKSRLQRHSKGLIMSAFSSLVRADIYRLDHKRSQYRLAS